MTPPQPLGALDRATRHRAGVGFATDLGRHGGRAALLTGTEVLTYDDLARLVTAARASLPAAPQLVGLIPAPTVEFVVAYLASLASGHTVLLARDHALPRAYGASRTWADGGFAPTGRPEPALHPELRLLLSTSGSTGSPKLVRLSRTNLESNAGAIAAYLDLTADDRTITTLPLDYCYGLSVLHSHLSVGAAVVLSDRSVAEPALWDLAAATGVTSFAGVPYTFDLLDAVGWPELPNLRRVTQAGGRLAPERVQAVAERGRREGWDLFVMYGQTEATARMAYLPPTLAAAHPAAIGHAIPGGSLRIDPVDGHPEGTAEGTGELVYTGPNVMMGYAHGVADLALGPELGELRTGDLARRNDAGLFEVVGRRSRFAKLFGQRIDLDRVETLLTLGDHEVTCAESADATRLVVALAGEPDPVAVEEVAAMATAVTGLPEHAVTVVPVAAVPRLPNGKVDQAAVARLEATRLETPEVSTASSLTAVYGAVLRRQVTPSDTFAGLGGDSLSYVELALRLERRLGKLPSDWPDRTIADLAGLASDAPRSGWFRLDTGIFLRAAAIVLIVGSHTNLFTLLGGAHVLLGVAGANFARFHLTGTDRSERRRNLVRSIARIAIPTSLWVTAVCLVSGQYGWRNILLLNDAIGSHTWREPAWHFWFIEALVYLMVAAGLLTAIRAVATWERRAPYWFAIALLVATLVPRFWATATGYDGDLIHSSAFVAWLFAGGWAAVRAQHAGHRLLLSALLLAGTFGFCDDPLRESTIALGLLLLVWVPTVPWPRVAIGVVGQIASASLYIYLTHWQVYPHLEDRWPLGGLLASLVVGIAAWRLVDLISDLRHRPASRTQYSPLATSIKEAR